MARKLVLGPTRQYQANPTAGAPQIARPIWSEVSLPLVPSFISGVEEAVVASATPVDFDSDGLATVIGVSVTIITGAVAPTGIAVVAGVSGVLAASDFDSDGIATVNIVGGVAAVTVLTDGNSSGVAVVDGKGGSAQGGVFNINGVAIVGANTGALARSIYGSVGQANVFGNGVDSAAVSTAGFQYVVTMRRRRRGHVNA